MNKNIKKLAQAKASKETNRTDDAGRSGMGESASSNVKKKSGQFSSANRTGIGVFKNVYESTGDMDKAGDAMYGSINNAYDYAKQRRSQRPLVMKPLPRRAGR